MLWPIFFASVAAILVVDLALSSRTMTMAGRAALTAGFMAAAAAFSALIYREYGMDGWTEFITGYLVEFSLSMDNIFLINMIFTTLSVSPRHQHRVLLWGVLGALAMRAAMIFAGGALIQRFEWILYGFAVFLLLSGGHVLRGAGAAQDETVDPKILKWLKKHFPFTDTQEGGKFFVRSKGRWLGSRLAVALITVEITDLIFAMDSIPAIFGITGNLTIAFTSNIFAVIGLRSLYFLLADIVLKFKYLRYSLGLILLFIGAKILLGAVGVHIGAGLSLAATFALLLGGIMVSLHRKRRKRA
ncbi:hypothetical protein FACS1894186_7560 [Alphaproteobacteria bacterium]|nr:hypothetical protein FACS1894186_7560 [Alphaproteobacteria bacterium]